MKTIGLLGGMSWESTIPYYRIVNRVVGERLGGLHSAKLLLFSVDFHEVEQMQRAAEWDRAGALLAEAAQALEGAGASFLVLCTNTMRRVAPRISESICIPLLHIADATAAAVREAGIERIGLLGTRFTMEEDFYRGRLEERHGLSVLVPREADRALVHRVIYDELCLGQTLDRSRAEYRRIIAELADRGAQGVILGCTEIGLLVGASDSPVPLFDTTLIHATKAALFALGD